MSNHPLPSTYGAPFNTHGHRAPLLANQNPGLLQHRYEERYQVPYLYGQNQPNGQPPAPHANSNIFHVNAHGVTPPVPGNTAHLLPLAGYGNQTHQDGTPPAPYPAPIPFGASPYIPQPSAQPTTLLDIAPHYNPISSHPQNTQAPTGISNIDAEKSNQITPPISELEDGELNDGESDKPVRSPEVVKMGSGFSRNPQAAQDEVEDASPEPPEVNNGVIKEPRFAPTERVHISSPQPQRPSLQNGLVNNLYLASSNPMSGDESSTDSPREGALIVQDKTISTSPKSGKAKQALLYLHSKGFDFDQIVNRGLRPDVLREIYAEVGVQLIHASPVQQQQPNTAIGFHSEDTATSRPPDVTASNIVDQQSESALHSKPTNGKIDSRPSMAKSKVEKRPLTDATSLPKSSKWTSSNLRSKASGTKAADSKGLDRQDYIARLKAAKASVSTKASTTTASEPSAPTAASRTLPMTSPATNQPVIPPIAQSLVQPATNKTLNTDIEAKRKAQTELARQKMEALKRRESIQQEAHTVNASGPDHQDHEPIAEYKHLGFFGTPTAIPRPPAASRQGSYFSPASQIQPFSIPGLFMNSSAPEGNHSHQHFPSQASAPAKQQDESTNSGSGYQDSASYSGDPSNKVSTATQAASVPRSSDHTGGPPPALMYRKRQKAADFIDSPPRRVKRPLGQQADTSVIIDVSEDEMSIASDDDSLDMGTDGRKPSPPTKSNTGDFGNFRLKSIKDLPPLTDLPPRKKPPVITPVAQTPSQNKDSKGLKSKEMEIEEMHRRIAELEQRINTKRNTSRAQTPGSSGQAPISMPFREPSQGINAPSRGPADADNPKSDASRLDSSRHSSSAGTEIRETATEEQLIAEQRLQEVELAKAKAEQVLTADAARASEEHQRPQEESLQAPLRELATSLPERHSELSDDSQFQIQDQERLKLQVSGQQQIYKGYQGAQRSEVSKPQQDDDQLLDQGQVQGQIQEADQRHSREDQRRLLDEQRRQRKSEIESGLPILESTMKKTREKLEDLRRETRELEEEIQKGIEGRNSLMEELNSLSQPPETSQSPRDPRSPSIGATAAQPPKREGIEVPSESSPSCAMADDPAWTQQIEAADHPQEPVVAPQVALQASRLSSQAAHRDLSETELEQDVIGDVMDISGSDEDEGEVSDHSARQPIEDPDHFGPLDDEESYEQTNDIFADQTQEPNLGVAYPDEHHQVTDADMEDVINDMPTTDRSAEYPTQGSNSIEDDNSNANSQDEQQEPCRAPSLVNDSDPEDYEPPEPTALQEEPPSKPASATSSHASLSPLEPDPNDVDSPLHSQSAPVPYDPSMAVHTVGPSPQEGRPQDLKQQEGRFTQYESPLKQFKSFRYHPDYLNEVSNGFRSLTYSHNIDSDIPICRYELGGVCNDETCPSQHLRDICLSDNRILTEIGATPEGLSPKERGNFTNGLRNMVHDIQSRKVKNIDTVAAEITEYRAKFLGDSFKILPL